MDLSFGKVGFAIGTGRCGTEFIARAAAGEANVASTHERNPYNETFHRYAKWYGLPIDSEGFLHQKDLEIGQDLQEKAYSFESSAYLSLSVIELYERYEAKFLLLVRSPERVVNSFYHKGWYAAPMVRKDPNLAPSYQECESFHHVLARFAPSGDKFIQWNAMSRVGKLAWYWNALNTRVLEQFAHIPSANWCIEKIETLDYERYQQAARFLGFKSTMEADNYQALVKQRPNAFSNVPTIASWSQQEIAEFEAEVAPMAEALGYEHRVRNMPVPFENHSAEERSVGLFSSAIRKLRGRS
jgi:hypothetical protein